MTFYLTTLILLFVLSFYKCNDKVYIFVVLFLSFFLGFRGETVGADTQRYIQYYNYMEYGVGYMEIGWNFLSVSVKNMGLSAYSFHFIIALLSIGISSYVMKKVNNNQVDMLGLFFLYSLGFYLLMFNGMRQMFAGSIVLLGYYYLATKRQYVFIIIILIASLFHASSLFALFAFGIKWLKLTNVKIILLLSISMLIGLMAPAEFFETVAGKKAHDLDTYGFRDSLTYAIIVGGLSNFFFLYIFNQIGRKMQNNNWIKLYLLSIMVMNMTINIVIGPRIVYVFSICQVIVFANLARNIQKTETIVLLYFFGFITFFRFMIPEMSKTEESLIPYYFTFQLMQKPI